MIVRRGATDKRVQELVRELRRVMAPHTAERLKERPGNSLKDFVHAAQPLTVDWLDLLPAEDYQAMLDMPDIEHGFGPDADGNFDIKICLIFAGITAAG